MYVIEKEFRFEAAHYLPNHDGKCRRLHGHSFVGRVYLTGAVTVEGGAKHGMVTDYGDVKSILAPTIEHYLDHWCLNDTLPSVYPTAEHLARHLFMLWKPLLPNLIRVRIEETCTSAAEYSDE